MLLSDRRPFNFMVQGRNARKADDTGGSSEDANQVEQECSRDADLEDDEVEVKLPSKRTRTQPSEARKKVSLSDAYASIFRRVHLCLHLCSSLFFLSSVLVGIAPPCFDQRAICTQAATADPTIHYAMPCSEPSLLKGIQMIIQRSMKVKVCCLPDVSAVVDMHQSCSILFVG
jgi:hypothetical protein